MMMSESPECGNNQFQSLYIPRIHNTCYKNNVGGHKFNNLTDFIKYTFEHLCILSEARGRYASFWGA